MSERQERQKKVITNLRWPVEMETSIGPVVGELKNISVDGAYVSCKWIPEPGEVVTATIKPPDKPSFQVTAEIIWARSTPQAGGGIAFTEISEDAKVFISKALT